RAAPAPPRVFTLAERHYWRQEISFTFHGRDILAPVAGHLSLGVEPRQLGPQATSWVELSLPAPRLGADCWEGEVLFVDDFGNLITNLPGEAYVPCRDRMHSVTLGGHAVRRQVRTYGEAEEGELVVLIASAGTIEIAEVQGNAAQRLQAGIGTPVTVLFKAG